MKLIRSIALLSSLAAVTGCGMVSTRSRNAPSGPPVSTGEVVAVLRQGQPPAPADSSWSQAPVYTVPLLTQNMLDPKLMAPSTPEVRVQAITDGSQVSFRLEWDDSSRDDLLAAGRHSDACAIQVAAHNETGATPSPIMGNPRRPVEIAYWSASWQATVDGRPDTIQAFYPGATVDSYPFAAAAPDKQGEMAILYAPTRSLGNDRGGPRKQPVEDLLAEGPGSLRPAAQAISQGQGVRTARGWAVVISRPLPDGWTPGSRANVAFAIWQGAAREVGSRKMRSVWVPISIGRRS